MMSSRKSPAAIPVSLHSLAFPVVEHGMPWLDMDVITVVILRIGDFKCNCKTQMRELRHHCRNLLLCYSEMNEHQYWALQHQITVDKAQPSVKYLLDRARCNHRALSMHVINLNIIAYTRSRSYRASFDENFSSTSYTSSSPFKLHSSPTKHYAT